MSTAAPLPVPAAALRGALCLLDDWVAVTLSGPDSQTYLQGQITANVNALDPAHYTLAAHCDAKGKMWSTLLLFWHQDQLTYLVRKSVADDQIAALKKFAIFSKVEIERCPTLRLTGIAGQQASRFLTRHFPALPNNQHPVVHGDDYTLLWIPQPAARYLLVATSAATDQLLSQRDDFAELSDSQQWLALDIEAGYPLIDVENSAQFLPQSVNLQALDGIDFHKGCYMGQEMVARAQYRGANKRALFHLQGNGQYCPTTGSALQLRLSEENWKQTGAVLASCRMADGTLHVQAVLPNTVTLQDDFRLPEDNGSALRPVPLPYTTTENEQE